MSTTTLHELKTIQPYYDALESGAKTFEIRFNDRDYQVGDQLRLREYDPDTDSYTGSSVYATVTYVTDFQQQAGYVVLGIGRVGKDKRGGRLSGIDPKFHNAELIETYRKAAAIEAGEEGPWLNTSKYPCSLAGIEAVKAALTTPISPLEEAIR